MGGINGMHPQFQQDFRDARKKYEDRDTSARHEHNRTIRDSAAKHGHSEEELQHRGLLMPVDES